VSDAAARADYGVIVGDAAATAALRAQLRATRGFVPFFDRGPGYRLLSGRDYAEVDLV
jgi:N-methylhydantoinase B